MKKLTAEEKLEKLAAFYEEHGKSGATVRGCIRCPYGDPYHEAIAEPAACPTCSKLDGSECVDEFLEWHDLRVKDYGAAYDLGSRNGFMLAVERMREWRASKVK